VYCVNKTSVDTSYLQWTSNSIIVSMFVDERYMLTAEGLKVIGISQADEGEYTCRAEVEIDGRYDERRINVSVHGKYVVSC
jgi:hypothetical protein